MKLTILEAANFMGIPLTITQEDLKAKYKELVKLYHPDISSLPNATELIQKLNLSFEILYDNVNAKPSINAFFGFDQKSFKNQNEFFADFFKRAFESTPKPTTFERDDGFNNPPPSPTNGWKRAASGNSWKRKLVVTAIVYTNKNNYKVMRIENDQKKYYTETFTSEELAQIWAETFVL